MSVKTPGLRRAPAGLKPRGRAFWRVATTDFELSEVEFQILHEVCRCLDELDSLRQAVDRDGPVVLGSSGQPRAHPAFGEIRQARASLGKMMAVLDLPDEDGDTLPTVRQARAKKAAETRWRPHNVAKEAARRG